MHRYPICFQRQIPRLKFTLIIKADAREIIFISIPNPLIVTHGISRFEVLVIIVRFRVLKASSIKMRGSSAM
jgi:hypothetical protein